MGLVAFIASLFGICYTARQVSTIEMQQMPPEILSLVTDYISLLDYLRLFSTARSIVQKKLEYTGKHFCWNQDQFVVCCEQGQSTYVKGILKATNVDPNLDCFFIERGTIDAVQWTSCLGTLEMLDLLLSHPRVQLSTNLCIRLASDYGRTEHVKRLLKDPRIDPTHALTDACRVGHYDVCKLLLEDPRVDPAEDDHWPLIHAALYQHTDCARLLLEHPSVDPSIRNNQAIRLASAKGHTNMVRLLLEDPRVDPSDWNNAALMFAANAEHTDIVALLLTDNRVDPSNALEMSIRRGTQAVTHLLRNALESRFNSGH